MTRGTVVPLTSTQIANRARYLGGAAQIKDLDKFVASPAAVTPDDRCPDIYYLLHEHNGGKDPRAFNPADYWSEPGKTFVNRTCDCIGGASWCGGFDRYQPQRFSHVVGYDGWINTDSMIIEARMYGKCFKALPRPEVGAFVVCASGSRGHKVGHIGTIIEVPSEWDPTKRELWQAIKIVDVAMRTPARANQVSTAVGWFDTNAMFVSSVMVP